MLELCSKSRHLQSLFDLRCYTLQSKRLATGQNCSKEEPALPNLFQGADFHVFLWCFSGKYNYLEEGEQKIAGSPPKLT